MVYTHAIYTQCIHTIDIAKYAFRERIIKENIFMSTGKYLRILVLLYNIFKLIFL